MAILFQSLQRRLAQLEEELNIVAKNMKQLEFSEQEALEREQSYIEQIREITERVKEVIFLAVQLILSWRQSL